MCVLNKQILLLENYIYEAFVRILLNLASFSISFFFLFLNKEIISILLLKIIFKNLTSTINEHCLIFPYFEYTSFNDISFFYGLFCITICFSVYMPIWAWQLLVNLHNISYVNYLTKVHKISYLIIYFGELILWYTGFITTYCLNLSYFQNIFNTQGSTNSFGLIIDYIPTLTHISVCYLLYIKILLVGTGIYFIFFIKTLNFKFKTSDYEYLVGLESRLKIIFFTGGSLVILLITPPHFALHLKLIFLLVNVIEIFMIGSKLLVFWKFKNIKKE